MAMDSHAIAPGAVRAICLAHLVMGRRGPVPKLNLHAIFNYLLRLLYLGCQWKALPIATNQDGWPEIHTTRIYRMFRHWQARGCLDRIFTGSVAALHAADLLDTDVLHGDGTTSAARKGGDNLGAKGFSREKSAEICP